MTSQDAALPITKHIRLKIIPGSPPRGDMTEVRAVLAAAKAKPGYDYSACLAEMISGTSTFVTEKDTFESCTKGFEELDKIFGPSLEEMKAEIAEYARQAYERGALPPAAPGGTYPDKAVEMGIYKLADCSSYIYSEVSDPLALRELGRRDFLGTPGCKEKLAKGYARILLESQLDANQCQRHPGPCRVRRGQVAQVLSQLDRLGVAPFLSPDERAQLSKDCDVADWGSLNGKLERTHEELYKQPLACVQLKSGESATVSGDTGTGGDAKYLLTRVGENDYKATINFSFKQADGKTDLDPQTRRMLDMKLNECFSQFNGGMLNLAGDKLRLAAYRPSSGEPAPPAQVVKVSDPDRMNSEEWHRNIDCPTMLHETLHVLGLPDEYHEKWMGHRAEHDGALKEVEVGADPDKTLFDCRTVSPQDSVMANPDEAFRAYRPKELLSCTCPKRNSQCTTEAMSLNADSARCPGGGAVERAPIAGMKGDTWRSMDSTFEYPNGRTKVFLNMPKPSILYPAQFRALINPGCTDFNARYYACSKDSTKTSIGNMGSSRCSVSKPDECTTGGDRWLR